MNKFLLIIYFLIYGLVGVAFAPETTEGDVFVKKYNVLIKKYPGTFE